MPNNTTSALSKLCLLLLIGSRVILQVTGASVFVDGSAGCKSNGYGLEVSNFRVNCTNKLCRVGDSFNILADVHTTKKLPNLVKVIPKICHANGYMCSGTLNDNLNNKAIARYLTPTNSSTTTPNAGNYNMSISIRLPHEDDEDEITQYFGSSSNNRFWIKAQLKPMRTTYAYWLEQQQQQQMQEEQDQEEGDDQQDDDQQEEEEEQQQVVYPTETLFCHIPLRYTNNDTFNVDQYFQNREAGRSWERTNESERTYESVGVVALLSLTVFGLRRRRSRTIVDDAEDDKDATDFMVFGDESTATTQAKQQELVGV